MPVLYLSLLSSKNKRWSTKNACPLFVLYQTAWHCLSEAPQTLNRQFCPKDKRNVSRRWIDLKFADLMSTIIGNFNGKLHRRKLRIEIIHVRKALIIDVQLVFLKQLQKVR